MSEHQALVYQIKIDPHPDPETINLGVVHIEGFTCVVNRSQWKDGDLAAYIEPDTLVPVNRDEFSFLIRDANQDGKVRIKARKIRGYPSFGLLVPAPQGMQVGDDAWTELGLERYEPAPLQSTGKKNKGVALGGDTIGYPSGINLLKYDLENGKKYGKKRFSEGEHVVATEKIHGQNVRFLYWEGIMWCGSRTNFYREYPSYSHLSIESLSPMVGVEKAKSIIDELHSKPPKRNYLWNLLDKHPGIKAFCQSNPGRVVYGECYGQIQKGFPYDQKPGEIAFIGFDIANKDGTFWDYDETRSIFDGYSIPQVPVVYEGPFSFDLMCELAEGNTLLGGHHVREGIVVRPDEEEVDAKYGRKLLKWVGMGYYNSK